MAAKGQNGSGKGASTQAGCIFGWAAAAFGFGPCTLHAAFCLNLRRIGRRLGWDGSGRNPGPSTNPAGGTRIFHDIYYPRFVGSGPSLPSIDGFASGFGL